MLESCVSCAPVNLTWWGDGKDGSRESQRSASPGSEKAKPMSLNPIAHSATIGASCVWQRDSAAQACHCPALIGLSSRDKHQAHDCRICYIIAAVFHAFRGCREH